MGLAITGQFSVRKPVYAAHKPVIVGAMIGMVRRYSHRGPVHITGLALLLAFSACTQGQEASTNQAGETAGAAKVTAATDKGSAASSAAQDTGQDTGPQDGGYIKLSTPEPRYLNPVLETRLEKANMLIFEGLVGLDARLEPVPRLAEKWEQSEDGKVITFHLRKGVSWHDGKPFTSQDVAFTWEAIQKTQATTLWKAYMSAVDGLETPDEHTVVVKYRYPYAPALSSWVVGILPKHIYGDDKLTASAGNSEPVGTGPYKLARWEKGKRLILQANQKWWNGRPHVDTIELLILDPGTSAIDALSDGQVDFMRVEDTGQWLDRAQTPEFRERFELSDVIESRIRLIAWNTQKAPLDDKRVRQALTMALDRERIIEDVLLSQARPLSAPFFPNMFGANPALAPHPFDLARATRLLDQAKQPIKDGKRFAIELMALESQRGSVGDDTLAIFRKDLHALGIDITMTFVSTQEFYKRINARDFDGVYFAWLPDIPDPDPYSLLHSSMIGVGANFAHFVSPDVDELLDKARAVADRNERKELYHQVHAILHDEMPYTPLYAPYGHYAWNRRMRGVNPSDITMQSRFPGLPRWWVADASRNR